MSGKIKIIFLIGLGHPIDILWTVRNFSCIAGRQIPPAPPVRESFPAGARIFRVSLLVSECFVFPCWSANVSPTRISLGNPADR